MGSSDDTTADNLPLLPKDKNGDDFGGDRIMQQFTLSHGGKLQNPRVAVTNDDLYEKARQTIEKVVDLAIEFGKENVEPSLSHMRKVYSQMLHAEGGRADWKQVAAQKLEKAEEIARQGKDNRLPMSRLDDLRFLVRSYDSLGLDADHVNAVNAAGGKIAARQRFEKLSHMSAAPRKKSSQVLRLIDDIARAGGAKAAGIDADRVMKFGPVQRLTTFAALSGLGRNLEPVADSELASEAVSPVNQAATGKTTDDYKVFGLGFTEAVELIKAARRIPGVRANESVMCVYITVPIGDNEAAKALAALAKKKGVTLSSASEYSHAEVVAEGGPPFVVGPGADTLMQRKIAGSNLRRSLRREMKNRQASKKL